jgi:hypothetical protein
MVYALHQIWEEFKTHQRRIHSKELWLHIMVQPVERGVQVLGGVQAKNQGPSILSFTPKNLPS